jgi:hypothetical protein
MSLITHRCRNCGHPDYWRGEAQTCPNRGCSCRCTPGPPEVTPTFDLAGQLVERMLEPGSKLSGSRTCDCAACKALYAELTGAAT